MSEAPILIGDLHALVRQLHGHQNTPEAKQSHSRLARDMWPRMKPEDIRDGILGVIALRDAGKIDAWEPGFGLRQALRWHHDGRQLWDAALDHWRHKRDVAPGRTSLPRQHPDIAERNPKDYGPNVRGTGPKPMADLLGRMGL